MALAATLQWDVRTTGSDNNGGAFDPVSGTPGTDYSQQDSPQVVYTDLVIGATTTQCTSAGTPFTSAHVGNLINITSGTGFTVQRVQILSVAATVATCDKSLGTTASTGGHGNLGGSLATIGPLLSIVAVSSNNVVNIKSGTYTQTSVFNLSVNSVNTLTFIGYGTTHNDGGTAPLLTTATNSTNLIGVNSGGGTALNLVFINIHFSNTAGTRAKCFAPLQNGLQALTLINCLCDGFSTAISGTNAGADGYWICVSLVGTEIKNSTGIAISNQSGSRSVYIGPGCYIHDNTGNGVDVASSQLILAHAVFARNAIGVNSGTSTTISATNCDFYANTSDGLTTPSVAQLMLNVINCIFYGNGGYGVNLGSADFVGANQNNAYGANSTAARHNLAVGLHDVSLSGDPMTSSTNFLLNGTAGAGASCKAAGYPGASPAGTGGLDIGAIQTPGSSPSYPAASSVYSGVDRGDGVLGTLHASNIATAAGHGVNLSAAILNSGSVVDDVTGSLTPGGTVAASAFGGPIS